MENNKIIKLLENKKNILTNIGYDTSDDNFDILVNGFIHIANSMITENMTKIPDKNISKIISDSIYYNIRTYSDELEENTKKILEGLDPIEFDFNFEDYISEEEKEQKKEYDKIINGIKNIIRNENNQKLLKFINNEGNDFILEPNIKEISILIKKNKIILDKFNKGNLTKEEELIINKLLTL